jgi:hypothetical protein
MATAVIIDSNNVKKRSNKVYKKLSGHYYYHMFFPLFETIEKDVLNLTIDKIKSKIPPKTENKKKQKTY